MIKTSRRNKTRKTGRDEDEINLKFLGLGQNEDELFEAVQRRPAFESGDLGTERSDLGEGQGQESLEDCFSANSFRPFFTLNEIHNKISATIVSEFSRDPWTAMGCYRLFGDGICWRQV